MELIHHRFNFFRNFIKHGISPNRYLVLEHDLLNPFNLKAAFNFLEIE